MERYTIYCTEEQTKKALELGAKIKKERVGKCITDGLPRLGSEPEEDKYDYLIPTAEQMIGWLEEQWIMVEVYYNCTFQHYNYTKTIKGKNGCWGSKLNDSYTNGFSSRKEATLAAIDAALDYLIKNKK